MCVTRASGSFFFFQAEDGIRDLTVTGVQTCALPVAFRACGGRERPATDDDHAEALHRHVEGDRKSTRLNSSHSQISYAVFCLKKKKKSTKKSRTPSTSNTSLPTSSNTSHPVRSRP